MKEFVNESFDIGADGGQGQAVVGIDAGMLKVQFVAGFPIKKALAPAADFLRRMIPGERYDKYADSVISAILKALGVDDKDVSLPADTGADQASGGVEEDEGSATHENLKADPSAKGKAPLPGAV